MCEKHQGKRFVLTAFAQVTQPLICLYILFSKLQFFSTTVLKGKLLVSLC